MPKSILKQRKIAIAAAELAVPSDDAALSDQENVDALVNGEAELSASEVDDEQNVVATKGPMRRKSHRGTSRAYAYRKLSRAAGYIPMSSEAASGKDALTFILSPHDVQRCFRFIPKGRGHSYSKKEIALRRSLLGEHITPKANQVAQARMDGLMRRVVNAAVKYIVETGHLRVSASVMTEILRPFGRMGEFTNVSPPEGVLMHAMKKGILTLSDKYDHVDRTDSVSISNDRARAEGRAENRTANRAVVNSLKSVHSEA